MSNRGRLMFGVAQYKKRAGIGLSPSVALERPMTPRDIIKRHEPELVHQVQAAVIAAIRLGEKMDALADDIGLTVEEALTLLGLAQSPLRAILTVAELSMTITYGMDAQ